MVIAFFVFAASALVARAVHLQVFNTDFLNRQADNRHLRTDTISAHRGSITDRFGEPLAISTPVDSIWANPQELATAVDRVPELARVLGVEADQLTREITRNMNKQFMYIMRHLSPDDADKVLALNLPGVNSQREYRRYYPAGEVAGHLVGFTDIDEIGLEGIELAYNHWLAGAPGSKRVLKDRLGRAVENVASVKAPQHGKDLRTSIDLRLQYLAYRALKGAIRKHGAESGSIVILDVTTGEVLAMVNQPSYNPNDRSQIVPDRYRNRAIADIFEPGSSIKPMIVAAALESGRYRAGSMVDTSPGYVVVGPKKIEDPRNLGRISMASILSRSSNVGITKVAMSLDADQLWQSMTRFGFGSVTSSGFPGESAGLLTHYSDWRQINQATIGYGYGVSVTPLQLAQAYAALGNDGQLRPVSLVALDEPGESRRIIDSDTALAVRQMMEEVVRPGGTGVGASVDGYSIAGKTGTSWKFAPGGYSEDKYFSIFAGLAPSSEPKLAAVVIIDEPTGELYYGGDVAAPVFGDIMAESLRLLAVPPDALPGVASAGVVQAMSQ
ncbi:MAG: penicillin-binding transpeptidase domain-containing protein [Gammaproteobacteria bacterium]|nr:penicillin-binding transpeptidase domain-containing protein [Gammaproteobacteria bacterium]